MIFLPHDAAVVFGLSQCWLEIFSTGCRWLRSPGHPGAARRQRGQKQTVLLNIGSWGKASFLSTCNTGMGKEFEVYVFIFYHSFCRDRVSGNQRGLSAFLLQFQHAVSCIVAWKLSSSALITSIGWWFLKWPKTSLALCLGTSVYASLSKCERQKRWLRVIRML